MFFSSPFLDPEVSVSAMTVVIVLLLTWCCYRFRKMPMALLIRNAKVTKLRIHIRDIIPDRFTVLDFYQMAPPSGSVVPFVLVLAITELSSLITGHSYNNKLKCYTSNMHCTNYLQAKAILYRAYNCTNLT